MGRRTKFILALVITLVALGVGAPVGHAASMPTITRVTGVLGVEPPGGSLAGGTPIAISGTNFTRAATVAFSQSAPTGEIQYPQDVVVHSSTYITATAPSWSYVGSAGENGIVVYTRAGASNVVPFVIYAPWIGQMLAWDLTGNGLFYPCTGTVVSNAGKPSRNVVLTAGHCVYGGDHFLAQVMFAPGYFGPLCSQGTTLADRFKCGVAPFGVWDVQRVYLAPSYSGLHLEGYDYAFLTMATLNGRHIGRVAGTYPVEFCYGSGGCGPGAALVPWSLFGEQPGEFDQPITLRSCLWTWGESSVSVYKYDDGSRVLLVTPCPNSVMSSGSSGGPWIKVDAPVIAAVNAQKSPDGSSMAGAYLGKEAHEAYVGAAS